MNFFRKSQTPTPTYRPQVGDFVTIGPRKNSGDKADRSYCTEVLRVTDINATHVCVELTPKARYPHRYTLLLLAEHEFSLAPAEMVRAMWGETDGQNRG